MTSLRDGVEALPTIGDATPRSSRPGRWRRCCSSPGPRPASPGSSGARPAGSARSLGFALLLVPLGAAIAMQQTPDASWQGAIVLVAVVLRIARGRLVPIVATASMVGAVALFGAQVAAPRAGWQPFGHHQRLAQFHELDTEPDLRAARRPAHRRGDARRHRAAAGAVADAGARGLRQPALAGRPRNLPPARTGGPQARVDQGRGARAAQPS